MPRDVFGRRQVGATPAWTELEEWPHRSGGYAWGNALGLRETENEPLVRGGWRPTKGQIEQYRERQEATDEHLPGRRGNDGTSYAPCEGGGEGGVAHPGPARRHSVTAMRTMAEAQALRTELDQAATKADMQLRERGGNGDHA